jgi:hypothetical protein
MLHSGMILAKRRELVCKKFETSFALMIGALKRY